MKQTEATSSFLEREEQWPPGFRFHPTDEELVLYYLKRKICRRRIELNAIADVDVYKADPDELPGLSRLKNGDRQWFFFSPRDRKYPNGGRSNRATRLGYWKATGKDRVITCNSRTVGIKKTLVFYKGRAPSGERTDWVMHEYTLDEEELKRCPAKDHYALYKAFKKSGPGPKNGEQYGAPFREEDWADDEKAIVISNSEQVTPLRQLSSHAYNGINYEAPSQINVRDDLFNGITNESFFQPISVDKSLLKENVQERGIINPPCELFNYIQPCLNLTRSASSQFQENSEVTFANNINRQGSRESGEGSFEDFLELDDLIGTDFTNQNIENPVDNFQIEDFDGLYELDLFEDVSMFLQDPGDTEPTSHTYNNNISNQISNSTMSCPNNFENKAVDQIPNIFLNNFQTGIEMVNLFDYQIPHDPDMGNQLWMNNQNFSMATSTLSNQGSVNSPTSGVLYAEVNQNQFQNQVQNQNTVSNEGGDSWLSSTLWSFVENIPTTPASAAESTTLVSKAFERISSFGRRGESVKINLLKTSLSDGNPNVARGRTQNRYNNFFLLLFVLGVLCAILWVSSGTSLR